MAWRCLSGTFVRVSDLLRPTGSTFRPHIAAEHCTRYLDHTLARVVRAVVRGLQRGPQQFSLLTRSNENFATSAFSEIDSIAVLRRRPEPIGDFRRSNSTLYTVIECAIDPWCWCAGISGPRYAFNLSANQRGGDLHRALPCVGSEGPESETPLDHRVGIVDQP